MQGQRWTLLATVFSAATLALAGVVLGVVSTRPTVASADREQTALLREMVAANEHFAGHLDRLEQDVGAVETAVGKLVLGQESLAPASAADSLPEPPAGEVTVQLAWDLKRVRGAFELYEPAGGLKLWDTTSAPEGEKVKTGAPIEDGILFLKPGEMTLVQVIWKNPGDGKQSFFVVPHLIDPAKYQAANQWKCLCTGVNFEVPPKGTFSRVIGIEISREVPSGAKLIGTHTVVGPMG